MSELRYATVRHFLDAPEDEIAERYMELPVDADGVPIRPRDEVDTSMGEKGPVEHLEYWYPNHWVVVIEYKPGQFTRYDTAAIRHYKPRTVEDVLRECAESWDYVSDRNKNDLLTKYADELRQMGVGE